MIVTIDGPAGSGKSTTAQGVAQHLGYVYLDTGAMYRALALGFLRAEAAPTDTEAEAVLPTLDIDVRYEEGDQRVLLNGADVTEQLRSPDVTAVVSRISSLPAVREHLIDDQRRIGFEQEEEHGGVILDGRDMGTVVFPDADVKIFMDADVEERARRRQQEYAADGKDVALDEVRAEIERRDRQDRNRDVAPLRKADDAIRLDTTDRTVENQVAFVVDRVKEQQRSGT